MDDNINQPIADDHIQRIASTIVTPGSCDDTGDARLHLLSEARIIEALHQAFEVGRATRPPAEAPCPRCGTRISIHPIH